MEFPASTDVLVVGAGPAGSAAAAWAAKSGREVTLADSAAFPRDKTCGDGLTPRATAELERLGLQDWVQGRSVNRGLRISGFGRETELPWPGGSLPTWGSAVPRMELDDKLRRTALEAGAAMVESAKAVNAHVESGQVQSVTFRTADGARDIACRTLIVADGVRSTLGKVLGRVWHRDTAYGVAARAYVKSPRSDDPWITSHLELRDPNGKLQPGYGWVFPLATGEVNIGVGYLATAKRPANIALRPLIELYADNRRDEWGFEGDLRAVTSALLPMGGSASNIAGRNWALVGDAAACVNPLNGEGIDYGLEGGRLLADILGEDLTHAWPALLREHYGRSFSVARRLAGFATMPGAVRAGAPTTLRSKTLMKIAIRVMGNLVTEEDDDLTARCWRMCGRASMRLDSRPPFS